MQYDLKHVWINHTLFGLCIHVQSKRSRDPGTEHKTHRMRCNPDISEGLTQKSDQDILQKACSGDTSKNNRDFNIQFLKNTGISKPWSSLFPKTVYYRFRIQFHSLHWWWTIVKPCLGDDEGFRVILEDFEDHAIV